MFDIGWTEMLVIGVIAIVVVGPKDLPRMLRTVGQYVSKAKRMAREFQTQFDDAVKDTELDDVRKSFEDLKSSNPTGEIGDALSPFKDVAADLQNTMEAAATEPGTEKLTDAKSADNEELSFADQAKATWDNSDAGKAAAAEKAAAEKVADAATAEQPSTAAAKPSPKKATQKASAQASAKPAAAKPSTGKSAAAAKPKPAKPKPAKATKPAKKATANG